MHNEYINIDSNHLRLAISHDNENSPFALAVKERYPNSEFQFNDNTFQVKHPAKKDTEHIQGEWHFRLGESACYWIVEFDIFGLSHLELPATILLDYQDVKSNNVNTADILTIDDDDDEDTKIDHIFITDEHKLKSVKNDNENCPITLAIREFCSCKTVNLEHGSINIQDLNTAESVNYWMTPELSDWLDDFNRYGHDAVEKFATLVLWHSKNKEFQSYAHIEIID